MKLSEIGWKVLAHVVSKPWVANAIIKQAQKTPYMHIWRDKSDELYMERWWLFNKYTKGVNGEVVSAKYSWLPSIRVHRICLADTDEHLHDHPWDARTIILKGWYMEEKEDDKRLMAPGDTGPIKAGDFHRIDMVSDGGVYTLFFTWKWMEEWGFKVDGVKIPYWKYLMDRENVIEVEGKTNG